LQVKFLIKRLHY